MRIKNFKERREEKVDLLLNVNGLGKKRFRKIVCTVRRDIKKRD